jgi:hypothetical protein
MRAIPQCDSLVSKRKVWAFSTRKRTVCVLVFCAQSAAVPSDADGQLRRNWETAARQSTWRCQKGVERRQPSLYVTRARGGRCDRAFSSGRCPRRHPASAFAALAWARLVGLDGVGLKHECDAALPPGRLVGQHTIDTHPKCQSRSNLNMRSASFFKRKRPSERRLRVSHSPGHAPPRHAPLPLLPPWLLRRGVVVGRCLAGRCIARENMRLPWGLGFWVYAHEKTRLPEGLGLRADARENIRLPCAMCEAVSNVASLTRYWCTSCKKPLHADGCFRQWHSSNPGRS